MKGRDDQRRRCVLVVGLVRKCVRKKRLGHGEEEERMLLVDEKERK